MVTLNYMGEKHELLTEADEQGASDVERIVMRLEHWCVLNKSDPYTPPELAKKALHGNVYGHPRFDDGKEVTTSRIVNVENGKIYTSSGSVYQLGEVDPDYELEYPDARARLFGA